MPLCRYDVYGDKIRFIEERAGYTTAFDPTVLQNMLARFVGAPAKIKTARERMRKQRADIRAGFESAPARVLEVFPPQLVLGLWSWKVEQQPCVLNGAKYLDNRIAVMDCIWRELPQPIAEEVSLNVPGETIYNINQSAFGHMMVVSSSEVIKVNYREGVSEWKPLPRVTLDDVLAQCDEIERAVASPAVKYLPVAPMTDRNAPFRFDIEKYKAGLAHLEKFM